MRTVAKALGVKPLDIQYTGWLAGLLCNIETVGGDSMSTKKRATKLKIMHHIDTDENGKNATIHSIVSNPPKLKEAVGPKTEKAKEAVKPKPKNKDELSDEQRSVLKALHDLGGKDKDIHSMDIAVKLGFDKKYPKAPRSRVRKSMDKLHQLHYVTSKKEGAKYSFRVADKGIEALKAKGKDKQHDPDDVPDHMLNEAHRAKEAASAVKPASNPSPSERPANTDIQCGKCGTFNPFGAIHCKECGSMLQALSTVAATAK